MAVDLSQAASLVNSETVIFSALAFFAGMAGVILYHRLVMLYNRRTYRADESVIESIVLEYTRRLRDYDRVIADIRTRIDVMDLRAEAPKPYLASQMLQPSQAPQHHVARVTQPVGVTHHREGALEEEMLESQNGTTDYILKMLAEKPRTSREVQQSIGRSREHTARLMKKLTESGLVERDVNLKPFKYTITGSGREMLQERVGVVSELRAP
ncbi:MAG: hypothetical protein ACREA4_05125 [Nitrososphaera sp.]